MRPSGRRARFLAAACLLAAGALAAPLRARAMSDEDAALVKKGENALYNCDYDGADALFGDALKERPADPVLALGAAVSAWWRMENDLSLPGSPEEKIFLSKIGNSIAVTKAARKTASGDDAAEDSLYLGAAYGLRGRWEASRKHWISAYFDGRRAYKYGRRAIARDPELYDAYLGLGAFDYYLATLSHLIRVLAFAGHGGKAKGLAELELASRKGRFSGDAAKLLLVGIEWTFEKKPENAWSLLDVLHERYPDSPLIDSMRLIGLFHLRDGEELKTQARAFLADVENKKPFYRPIDAAGAYYFLGVGEQLLGESEDALRHYRAGLALAPDGQRVRSLLWLAVGEAQDLLGRRDAAKDSYRQALRENPLWGVPRYARFLIKHPFRPGANPLPGRNDALQ
ncbi:MAG: hypothetical protein KGM24_02065 [Elusimicrobia bacterium]|nr:hypothetical protein [Elusimicrobiota bacterium]